MLARRKRELGAYRCAGQYQQAPSPREGGIIKRTWWRYYDTLPDIIGLIGGAGYDKLVIETVGAGQNETRIREHVDNTAVVVVPGMGDAVQMDKAGILEIADEFVINKADFSGESKLKRELLDIAAGRPIYETIATRGQGVVDLLDGLFG